MSMIADFFLAAGALGAATYCLVLSRRLKRLTQLETGMGGAIAVLSAQVDDMTRTLGQAQAAACSSASSLESRTARAEAAVKRLEVLLAALHDLPERQGDHQPQEPKATEATAARRSVMRRRSRSSFLAGVAP